MLKNLQCKWNVTCCRAVQKIESRERRKMPRKSTNDGVQTKIRMSNSYCICGCWCCCCRQQIKPVDKIYGVQKSWKSHPCGNLVLSTHTIFADALCARVNVWRLTMQEEHDRFTSFDAKNLFLSLFSPHFFTLMWYLAATAVATAANLNLEWRTSDFYFLTANTAYKY